MRVIGARIDALEVSYYSDAAISPKVKRDIPSLSELADQFDESVSECLAEFCEDSQSGMSRAKSQAKEEFAQGRRESFFVLGGVEFVCKYLTGGAVLSNSEVTIAIRDNGDGSLFALQFRAAFLATGKDIEKVAAKLCILLTDEILFSRVTRLDVCADTEGLTLIRSEWQSRIVTKARTKRDYVQHYKGKSEITGITVGSGKLLCRIYNKTIELGIKGKNHPGVIAQEEATWKKHGWTGGTVWRCEFQLRSEALKTLSKERDLHSIIGAAPSIWGYCTRKFLRFGTYERTDNEWKHIQDAWGHEVADRRECLSQGIGPGHALGAAISYCMRMGAIVEGKNKSELIDSLCKNLAEFLKQEELEVEKKILEARGRRAVVETDDGASQEELSALHRKAEYERDRVLFLPESVGTTVKGKTWQQETKTTKTTKKNQPVELSQLSISSIARAKSAPRM